jgi:hypothetical protein
MKRSEIKRGTKGLARGGELASRSTKRSKLMRTVRAPAVSDMVEAGVQCQVGIILAAAGLASRCTLTVQGLHERRKRSSAGSLVNPDNLLGSCNRCNDRCEEEPALVRRLTGTQLIVREGDDEWESLGSRHDRMI